MKNCMYLLLLTVALGACATFSSKSGDIYSGNWHPKIPEDTNTTLYFDYQSPWYANDSDAMQKAEEEIYAKIAKYIVSHITSKTVTGLEYERSGKKVLVDMDFVSDTTTTDSKVTVSHIKIIDQIIKPFKEKNREGYRAWYLAEVPKDLIDEKIVAFPKEKSEAYKSRIERKTNLYDKLSEIITIRAELALPENALYRSITYYETPGDSLYDCLSDEIQNIAKGIRFLPTKDIIIQKADSFIVLVSCVSEKNENIGAFNCYVSVYRNNKLEIEDAQLLNSAGGVKIGMKTAALPLGRYTVHYELPLKDLAPQIKTNPGGSFSFTVAPVYAAIAFTGDLDARQKNTLFTTLQRGLKPYDITLLEEGKAPPVTEVQNHYAFTVSITQSEPRMQGSIARVSDFTVAINFERNGEKIGDAITVSKTESATNKTGALESMKDTIEKNSSFFENINKGIGL